MRCINRTECSDDGQQNMGVDGILSMASKEEEKT